MTSTHCLNCEKELSGRYCSGCGQKAATHRISFQYFILHDVVHGLFHLDKGMVFTAKQSLLCPGQAALDYISGKRTRYYNVFLLVLLTFGFILFLRHFYEELVIMQGDKFDEEIFINDASRRMDEMLSQKSKLIIFLFVPLGAVSSFLLFRKKKLNLSEHAIIAGMILLGMLLISALGNLLFYFNLISESETLSDAINLFTPVLVVLHIGYGYFNAFGKDYSRIGIAYRLVLFYALLCLQAAILFFILWGFISNWEFGSIKFSPF